MFNPFNKKFHPFMDADTGANGGSVADSQDTDTNLGVDTDSGIDQSGGETDSNTNTDLASQKTVQTPEQRAFYAEARRKAEMAERKAQQAEAARQRDINIAKKYGAEYGVFSEADIAAKFGQSHSISTLAEFEAALQNQAAIDSGIDPNMINQFVSSHPDVQKARQFMEQMSQQQAQAQINSEVAELAEEYPELKIKSFQDLQGLPNFESIIAKAQKGYTLLDAYVAVNRNEIRRHAKEQGSQQAIRNISSKSHLGTEKSGNQPQGKEVELSPEQLRVWTAMGYTEAEARKRAAKYIKK